MVFGPHSPCEGTVGGCLKVQEDADQGWSVGFIVCRSEGLSRTRDEAARASTSTVQSNPFMLSMNTI
jgi:hypothetical protein